MSKQRFEVVLNFEIRETTDSDGHPSDKRYFSSEPVHYYDMPLGGVVVVEKKVLNLLGELVEVGETIAKAVEGNSDCCVTPTPPPEKPTEKAKSERDIKHSLPI